MFNNQPGKPDKNNYSEEYTLNGDFEYIGKAFNAVKILNYKAPNLCKFKNKFYKTKIKNSVFFIQKNVKNLDNRFF